jgi:hypothetical protein
MLRCPECGSADVVVYNGTVDEETGICNGCGYEDLLSTFDGYDEWFYENDDEWDE